VSKRPRFRASLREWMDEHSISSYEELAEILREAGYPRRIYGSKISGFVNANQCVPDEFLYWMDRAVGISDEWAERFARAMMAPCPQGEEVRGMASYQEETERLYSYGFALAYDAEDADPNPKDHDPRGEIWRYGPTGDLFTRADALRYIKTLLE
jgi:hypothetical protein